MSNKMMTSGMFKKNKIKKKPTNSLMVKILNQLQN